MQAGLHRADNKGAVADLHAEEVAEVAERVRVDEVLDVVDEPLHAVAHGLVHSADELVDRRGEVVEVDLVGAVQQVVEVEIEVLVESEGGLERGCRNDTAEVAAAVPDAGLAALERTGEEVVAIFRLRWRGL